ncbi:MAG TPA: Nif3-like dinuclear metal center hexameric protein [Symbiobacteriaceae bacterium]
MSKVTIGTITALLEELAPPEWAESWDNVGLQVGDPGRPVQRLLVALELTDGVVEEAVRLGASLVVVHHPPLFRPLKAIRLDTPAGARLERLIKAGIGVYAAHTNLDQAPGGTNDTLAQLVGLKDWEVLEPAGEERYFKLVVFVPRGYEDAVRQAMAEAGAGHIGNYSHCTFQAPGTGTFLPLEGTNPFLGQQGRLEYADEYRLETIVPQRRVSAVVKAMIAAHPYEEVAYDLYPLANPGKVRGHGRIGKLETPTTLGALAERLKQELGLAHVAVVGDPHRTVATVAVGAGAGGSLVQTAARRGADVLVTGDVKYHDARDAADAGLGVIDIGHYSSERIVVRPLAAYLRQRLAEKGLEADVVEYQAVENPFRYL